MIQQLLNVVTPNIVICQCPTDQVFAWLQQIISLSIIDKSMIRLPLSDIFQIFVAHKCPFYSKGKTDKSVIDH